MCKHQTSKYQSLFIDIMHQEELGLLKKEISLLYEGLSSSTKSEVDTRLYKMPTIPGFPSPAVSLQYAKHFQAKDWISIAKCILIVCEGNV